MSLRSDPYGCEILKRIPDLPTFLTTIFVPLPYCVTKFYRRALFYLPIFFTTPPHSAFTVYGQGPEDGSQHGKATHLPHDAQIIGGAPHPNSKRHSCMNYVRT